MVSREAALYEIYQFLLARPNLQRRAHGGTIKISEIAHIVVLILGHTSSDDSFELMCRTIRTKIQKEFESANLELRLLDMIVVLGKFCKVEISEHDLLSLLWEGFAPPPRASAPLPLPPVDTDADGYPNLAIVPEIPVPTFADRMAELSEYSKEDLKLVLIQNEDAHHEEHALLRAKYLRVQQRARNAEKRNTVLEDKLEAASVSANELVQATYWRTGSKHISVFGGYSLAIVRNIGHAGAKEVVAMCAGDEVRGGIRSKKVVWEYEHKAAIAMNMISSSFHEALVLVDSSLLIEGLP